MKRKKQVNVEDVLGETRNNAPECYTCQLNIEIIKSAQYCADLDVSNI